MVVKVKVKVKIPTPSISLIQSRQLEEWNARIETKHHDRSTKHNTQPKK